jgi:hypothetical protein
LWNEAEFSNVHKLHKTLISAQSKLEDYLYEKYEVKDKWYTARVLFILWINAFYWPTGMNSSIVLHELGHWITASQEWKTNVWYGFEEEGWQSLWDLFIKWLTNPFARRFTNYEWTEWDRATISWAWINTNSYMANLNYRDSIKNWLMDSFTSDTDYLYNKSEGLRYSKRADTLWHDVNMYIDELNDKWINISKEEVIKYQALSFFLSWGTISSVKNIWKFLYNWERGSEPIWLEYDGYKFYLPEFNTWMNWNNFSFEVLQYIKNKNMMYELWVETVVVWEWDNIYTVWFNKIDGKNTWWWTLKTDGVNWSLNMIYEKQINNTSSLLFEWNISDNKFGSWRVDRNYGNNWATLTYTIKF